ncbi:MAG: vanadium-dependent haloperoxidase [Ignavibacteriaceae bacterium]|nr:vanadium-dependent haloperoxidase [Ignavibacteriaceae bacterium]
MKNVLTPSSTKVGSYSLRKLMVNQFLLAMILILIIFTNVSKADAVIDWNATAVSVQQRLPNPNRSSLPDLAYLHIAIYDAVNAIDGGHPIFAIDPPNKVSWANLEAAVHSAARRILMTFYSADSVYIDSVYQARISLLPNDSTTTKGAEIGNTTAVMYVALRTGDGRQANIPYVWQPLGPGLYQPTPPGSPQYVPAVPWQAQLLPFSFLSPSLYRAPDPPLLTSNSYTTDFNEVKMYGSLDTTYTTPEQREIALFHTENPGIHVPRNIRAFATSQSLSLVDNARFFAQIYVSIGDALISGWNSKYFYNRWRPSTAIRNADIDGNPATEKDTLWQPLAVTPRHPEYVAAHGVVSGAIAYTIQDFFGTPNITITLTSTVTGTQHTFTNIYDYLDEIANARVWGGMHFRTSCEEGVQIGQDVATHVANLFVPVELISFNLQ